MGPSLVASALLVSAGLAGAAAPAAAEAPAEPAAKAPAEPAAVAHGPTDLSHKGQLEASVRFGLGLRAIATYDSKDYCGDTDPQGEFGYAPVCTGRAPFSIDLELGYGVARRVDLLVELRVGLESDIGATPAGASGPRMFHISPGARFFFSEGSRSKLFTTAQLVIDLAGYQDTAGADRGNDFGIRNLSGLWVDLKRNYGFYVFAGPTATFARWMRFELEGGLGISGRYP
jgi:hypothetical protein